MNRERWINWGLFCLLALIWGSSFILMRISREALNGYQIGATRIFSAGLFFLPAAFFHIAKIKRSKLALVALSGFLGNLLPAFLFGIAIEHHMDSALAGILNSLTPLFVILIAAFFFNAGFQKRKISGVLIGLAGLVILSLSKGGISTANMQYAALILIATISYGLNVNIVTHFLKGEEPIKMATVSLALMAIPAGLVLVQQHLFSMAQYDVAARWSIAAAVLLGVMGSAVATALFYVLIKRAGGLFASLVTYAIPVVAIFWGLVAHENITWLQVVCLGIILGGVYLVNSKAKAEMKNSTVR
ncbi:MAG TPA: DMT family transporter [Chitinophagaceae bacterium]|nr:DMT family transporter [Chitinophagaceae bacterium]